MDNFHYKRLQYNLTHRTSCSTYILSIGAMRRRQMRQKDSDWRLWHLIDKAEYTVRL